MLKTFFYHQQPSLSRRRAGQAMLLATLTIGGAILGATTLAGFLMLYQIRSTTDSENSAKAIFAADTGVNWALYSYFHPPAGPLPGNNGTLPDDGATVSVTCYDENNNLSACDISGATTTAISEGVSASSRRAFFADLTNASATVP